MAETISGKKIKDLTEATALNDTDDMIVENATPKTQKVKWSTIYNAIKAKLANWTFTMNTTAKTIPGAVNELKTAVDKQNSDLANIPKVRYASTTLSWTDNNTLQGYVLFSGTVLCAVATIEYAASTPIASVTELYTQLKFGGTGSRIQVYAKGSFVSGHVLKVNVIGIVQE